MSASLMNTLSTRHLRMDFMGGLTAAVVALPLALAFGVASGAGPAAGIYGAIFVGFFAALFGGTARQVSGPTGPMTVVMAGVFTSLQAKYPEAGLVMGFSAVILAGLMQIALGLLKLGKYFILVPYPVISGFMTGIGVIIIILQLGPMLGHAGASSLIASLESIPGWLQSISGPSLMLGVLSLAIVYFWPARLAVWCPPPLAALLLGTGCALLWLPSESVAVIGDIPSGFPIPHWPVFTFEVMGELFYAALLLAVLGSIDSLLTSLVADNLTKEHHNSDKELIGQGIGNTVSGFFGGLPGAGATMRTVVNIRAGGKTGYSGAIHSVTLLVIMLGAGKYAAHVPLAVLAGILMRVGIDIIDWPFFMRLRKLPVNTVVLMLIVLFMTVFVDLITAVLVGVFISNLITIERLTSIQLDSIYITDGSDMEGDNISLGQGDELDGEQSRKQREGQRLKTYQGAIVLLRLDGPLSFGVGRGLRLSLAGYESYRLMIIDLTGAHLVGTSTAMILDELVRSELSNDREIYLVGISKKAEANLSRLGTLECLSKDRIFSNIDAAIDCADKTLLKPSS
jgi:sulfate permease, SulP family